MERKSGVMSELTCKDFFESLPDRFRSEKAGDLKSIFQFDILGDQGGKWFVEVKEGTCKVEEGKSASPDLTATINARDFIDIITGKLKPQNAFFTGRLAIRGNQSMAFKFASIFF